MISRVHSHIVYAHHQWKLRDNRSVNGVFVNDRKIHEAVLNDGDVVVFGGGGNRPIGAFFPQRDSEFKYQFRTNPQWIMSNSTEEESEDDTVENGEQEAIIPTSETPLFDMPASEARNIASSSIAGRNFEKMVEENEEGAKMNPKKRKRSPNASELDFTEQIMIIDVDQEGDNTQMTEPVEWQQEPAAKKFCAAPIAQSSTSTQENNAKRISSSRIPKEDSTSRSPSASNATNPKTDSNDVGSRLMEAITNEEATKRIAMRQAALFEACAARRAGEPIFPFPDESPLQCKYCKNLMLNPTTIGCGHAMCDGCVEALAIENPQCPVCAQSITLPIQTNMELQGRIIDIVREWNTVQRQEWIYRMLKRNEAVKLAGLELLLESCKARGIRFLNIEERWTDEERATFIEGIDIYTGASRVAFCRAVGLTASWLEKADFDKLLLAISNIGITMTPSVNKARAIQAQLSAASGASLLPSVGLFMSSPEEQLESSSNSLSDPNEAQQGKAAISKSFEDVVLQCIKEGILHHIATNRRIALYYNQYQQQIQQQQQQQQLQQLQQLHQRALQVGQRPMNAGPVVIVAQQFPALPQQQEPPQPQQQDGRDEDL